ncbi:MAG: hypothetical protein AB2809_10265 [Candidatus Thiodiazotropha sp.]
MKKAYILIYNDIVGTRAQVKEYVDSMSEVWTWRYDMPHVFYIISTYSAEKLTDAFRKKTGDKGRFMFSEVNDNYQGLMLEETWYLLNNKHNKPKKEE